MAVATESFMVDVLLKIALQNDCICDSKKVCVEMEEEFSFAKVVTVLIVDAYFLIVVIVVGRMQDTLSFRYFRLLEFEISPLVQGKNGTRKQAGYHLIYLTNSADARVKVLIFFTFLQ
jgi:hypothetical protein